MQRARWNKRLQTLLLGWFLLGCSASTELKVRYYRNPAELLSSKPILVRQVDSASRQLADQVRKILAGSGYRILQDTEITAVMLEPFGSGQVLPLTDYTEIEVRLSLDSPRHDSQTGTRKVNLQDCNYLLEKSPCSSRSGEVRFLTSRIIREAKGELLIRNANQDPVPLRFSVSVSSSGVLPASTNAELSKALNDALRHLLKGYLKQNINESTGLKIDALAHDLIQGKLYEAAAIRIRRHEDDHDAYYYALGYIEELRANFSGAREHYRTGEKDAERPQLFNAAIKRLGLLKTQQEVNADS
ncbi:MAG: hypothetical protein QF537_14680 [SAR324 cluster bacterium]|jgi:hypothetical protein|nr:hypothetical protein [SAR324 cluster bacterium]MDP7498874.1 hypothetical protein [SAR324 cluster bacterium]